MIDDAATLTFSTLKESMCTTPILSTHDFTNNFVLECGALSRGLGVSLVQEGHPMAFTSK